MKKFMAILLCALVLCGLSGCGGKEESAQPVQTEPAAEATVPTQPQETEGPTLPVETTEPAPIGPAFDISFARNAYEALLPELPLGDHWYGEQDSDTRYSIDISKTSADALLTYVAQLEGLGYQLEETEALSYTAVDQQGNTFAIFYHDGAQKIMVDMRLNQAPAAPAVESVDTSWASNDFEAQIPTPPVTMPTAEWYYPELENKAWYMNSYDASLVGNTAQLFEDYTAQLYHCGYTAALRYEYWGAYHQFSALNPGTGFFVDVFCNEENGAAVFTIKVYDLKTDLGDWYPGILGNTSQWDGYTG